MKPAIRVDNLSKLYRIGSRPAHDYRTLQDTLVGAVTAPWRRFRALAQPAGDGAEAFWALKDVGFEVQPGETLGVIGRNGAGKSTLLKILSRVTEPTRGRVELRGRLGSLLEVGTGFHSELTGRENIYLNGAILGMTRREITRKFDEIVAFAGVDPFLDTPVKRYSSGMYVRLAFAVAAHLEPEILVVDEVLAVGDVEFQKKCLGKMRQVGAEGRTVLFVSHSIGALQGLCRRGLLLHKGQVVLEDTIGRAVAAYLRSVEQDAGEDLSVRTDRRGRGAVRLTAVQVTTLDGLAGTLVTGRPARFAFRANPTAAGVTCQFTVYDARGLAIAHFNSGVPGSDDGLGAAGDLVCELDELPLLPGRYRLNVALNLGPELQDHVEGAAVFDVEEGTLRGRPIAPGAATAAVCLPHRWTVPAAQTCAQANSTRSG